MFLLAFLLVIVMNPVARVAAVVTFVTIRVAAAVLPTTGVSAGWRLAFSAASTTAAMTAATPSLARPMSC